NSERFRRVAGRLERLRAGSGRRGPPIRPGARVGRRRPADRGESGLVRRHGSRQPQADAVTSAPSLAIRPRPRAPPPPPPHPPPAPPYPPEPPLQEGEFDHLVLKPSDRA